MISQTEREVAAYVGACRGQTAGHEGQITSLDRGVTVGNNHTKDNLAYPHCCITDGARTKDNTSQFRLRFKFLCNNYKDHSMFMGKSI